MSRGHTGSPLTLYNQQLIRRSAKIKRSGFLHRGKTDGIVLNQWRIGISYQLSVFMGLPISIKTACPDTGISSFLKFITLSDSFKCLFSQKIGNGAVIHGSMIKCLARKFAANLQGNHAFAAFHFRENQGIICRIGD